MKANKLDVELIKKLFFYDVESPSCLRAKINSTKRKAGDVAGSIVKATGYWAVKVKGKAVKVHRVILVLHGHDLNEDDKTDHINGNKLDNRIENLRIVLQKENAQNQKMRNDNTTGKTGVDFRLMKSGKISWRCRWNAVSGKQKSKTFYSEQDAINHRELMIAELNKNGAGYTERHGK